MLQLTNRTAQMVAAQLRAEPNLCGRAEYVGPGEVVYLSGYPGMIESWPYAVMVVDNKLLEQKQGAVYFLEPEPLLVVRVRPGFDHYRECLVVWYHNKP